MRTYLLLFSILLGSSVFGQDTLPIERNQCSKKHIAPMFATGPVGGAHITSNSIYLKYGGGIYAGLRNNLTERLSLGIGAGIEQIDDERLYPFFLEGRGLLSSKETSGFLLVQMGYAVGSNPSYENYEGYKYRGGGLFSAGWGYRWPLKNDDYISISTSLRQQFIHLSYSGTNDFSFRERLSYSLISVRVGIDF